MPFTFTSDPTTRLLRSRATGRLTLRELLAYVEERSRANVLAYDQLADLRGALMDLDSHEARSYAAARRRALGTQDAGVTAIIADGDATYGVARMLEVMMQFEGITFAVFRDARSAEAWLWTHRTYRLAG